MAAAVDDMDALADAYRAALIRLAQADGDPSRLTGVDLQSIVEGSSQLLGTALVELHSRAKLSGRGMA